LAVFVCAERIFVEADYKNIKVVGKYVSAVANYRNAFSNYVNAYYNYKITDEIFLFAALRFVNWYVDYEKWGCNYIFCR
jgi:hypothetical protein